MVRRMVLGALALLVVVATPAAAQYPDFVVSPGQAVPGGTVSFTGGGCEPGEVVTIGLVPGAPTRAAAAATVVATVTADDGGTYSGTFVVPAGLAPGTYAVTASCGTGVEGAALEVLAPTVPPTTPGNGGSLPRTGSDLNGVGLVGAGLLTAGGLILVANRRRKTATS